MAYQEKLILALLLVFFTSTANAQYAERLIVCKVKCDDDGCRLDLPFQVFHSEVVYKGVKYGPYQLPKSLDKQEVLALVTYSTEAREVICPFQGKVVTVPDARPAVESIKTAIVSDFQKDARVATHWAVTKADYYATTEKVGDVEVVKPYTGPDASDRAEFYPSDTFVKAEAKPIEEPIEEDIIP